MVTELHGVCDLLERDPRVLLLAGKGGNFAAGADISQLRERRRDDALRGINSALFDRIHRLPMPVIGLLDGFALGGGAELAYACDFRIGTPRLRIGNPEPGLGILAAAGATGGSRSWSRACRQGDPPCRPGPGRRGSALRLLNEIAEPDALLKVADTWADRITRHADLAVRLTKAAFHAPRDAHPYIDDLAQAVLFETEEKHERMTAFLEKKTAMTVPNQVGVYGGGPMGAGIAHAFLVSGAHVTVIESSAESAEAARARVETSLARAADRGHLRKAQGPPSSGSQSPRRPHISGSAVSWW